VGRKYAFFVVFAYLSLVWSAARGVPCDFQYEIWSAKTRIHGLPVGENHVILRSGPDLAGGRPGAPFIGDHLVETVKASELKIQY